MTSLTIQDTLENEKKRLKAAIRDYKSTLQIGSTLDWASGEFSWDKAILDTKTSIFKINEEFREHQREVINAFLSGKDCFVIMVRQPKFEEVTLIFYTVSRQVEGSLCAISFQLFIRME